MQILRRERLKSGEASTRAGGVLATRPVQKQLLATSTAALHAIHMPLPAHPSWNTCPARAQLPLHVL